MFNSNNNSAGNGSGNSPFNIGGANSNSGFTLNSGNSSGGLFGSNNTASNANSGDSLFGNSAQPAATSGSSLFGNSGNNATSASTNTASATNKQDSTTGTGGSLFGGSGTTASSGGGGLFGNSGSTTAAANNALGTSGNNQSSTTGGFSFGSKPFSSNQTSNSLGGQFSLGSSQNNNNASDASKAPTTSLFGSTSAASGDKDANAQKSSSFSFGSAAPAASSKKPEENASKGTTSTGNNQSLFGFNSASSSNDANKPGTLFGSTLGKSQGAEENKASEQAKPAGSSLFSFGKSDTSEAAAAAATKKPEATGSFGGLFGKPAEPAADKSQTTKPSFSFGSTGSTTAAATKDAETKPASGFSFGTGAGATSDASKDSGAKPSGVSFGSLTIKPTADTNANKDTESKQSTSLFGAASQKQEPAKTEEKKPGFSFGGKKENEPQSTITTTGTSDKESKINLSVPSQGSSNPAVAESVPVQPGEYLKNKSFEDIIAKWTSSLTKSVERFKEQAAETSKWDQILVDNGTKIADIYNEVTVAEQAQSRIDDVLTYVSRQQDDIDVMLSQLESQTSSANSTGFVLDNLQPVDKERYDAYSLAEQLNDKVESLEGSLSSIISEMNDLTRESHHVKESDPVAHIVKILNAHLASLQFIDESASELQKKLVEAHSRSSRIKI